MNIRDTLQGIRYDIDHGDVDDATRGLGTIDALFDDLGKLKAQCLEEPDRALVLVVELCDSYGIVVAQ